MRKEIQPQIIGPPKQKTRINGANIIKSIIIGSFSELKNLPEYNYLKVS